MNDPRATRYAGYHRFRDEAGKPIDGTSCWIVWRDHGDTSPEEFGLDLEEYAAADLAGWYYAPCYPGCLPDSDFTGPFETSRAAFRDAMNL